MSFMEYQAEFFAFSFTGKLIKTVMLMVCYLMSFIYGVLSELFLFLNKLGGSEDSIVAFIDH
jgi:hypothetical protein